MLYGTTIVAHSAASPALKQRWRQYTTFRELTVSIDSMRDW